MIVCLSSGQQVDTERDLTAAERHIVQKLYAWASIVESITAFRAKKAHAFKMGWNDSGPVPERQIMRKIAADLEKSILARIKAQKR